MRSCFLALIILTATVAGAQSLRSGVIADSASRQPLPFATVQATAEGRTVIAGIDGRFSIAANNDGVFKISYSGHRSTLVPAATLRENDTVFLAAPSTAMDEIVVRSQSDKIRRIINTAIRAKALHNPDNYAAYNCNIYYKMIVDIAPFGNFNRDSIRRRQDSLATAWRKRRNPKDTAVRRLPLAFPSHLFVTETFSKRLYKKPGQTQEVVLASKFSGLQKTYFANLVTNVLPFHVYSDFIALNSIDFVNPLAKGWQSRYRFLLEDELVMNGDTVFILSYRPRATTSFNSLNGLLYISSRGYAVTHFTGSNNAGDASAKRLVKFEHIYGQVAGRWFPQELNYDFAIPRMPADYLQLVWNGRSVIDSVRFDGAPPMKFDKAHPLKLSDSVDLRSNEEWRRFRRDSLSLEEKNTYRNMDSLAKATKVESFLLIGAKLATGRLPIGAVDLDVRRLFATNPYEGTRLGLGLYSNNKVSKYYSVGGWWGYGFKDKAAKYGASLMLFPKGDKETWLSLSYQKFYRLTGEVALHPELSQQVLRSWLLQRVDEVKEYAVAANLKPGYWEVRPSFVRTQFGPLHYAFEAGGKTVNRFTTNEATVGLRYAYGEKRVPFFDTYLPAGTKYPVLYASLGRGQVSAPGLSATYYRMLAAATFTKHINRWGADRYRVEAGAVLAQNAALPQSLLLAGNGFGREGINFYSFGGFLTMRPFAFYSDRYAGFLYRHDFDKNFYDLPWSKPYLTMAHNLVYGALRQEHKAANPGVQTYTAGYHESGILLNRLLRYNLGFADAALNVGAFYHWQQAGGFRKNSVWVFGVSTGF